MNVTDKLDLCDDGNILSKRISYLRLVSYLRLNLELATIYSIKVEIWRKGKWKKYNL